MRPERVHLGASEGRSNSLSQQLREQHPASCHRAVMLPGIVLLGLVVLGVMSGHVLLPTFAGLFVLWLVIAGAAFLLLDPLLSIRERWPSAVHRAGGSEFNGRAPRIRLGSLLANLRQGWRPAVVSFNVERDSASAADLNEVGGEIGRRLGWDRCEVEDSGRVLRVRLYRLPSLDTRGPSWER